ncbi:MAG TPA: gamma-glutamyltransferase [Acidimicrobiia bacterium]
MPRIAVAGPSKVVTDAAVAIGNDGGSVVDVALVAALTAMCTEPGICGPGGGGFITVDVPGHDPVVVDGYMAFPGKGFSGRPNLRKVQMRYGGGVTTLVDAGSVAVPGAFAALEMAWQMFGTAPWADLMGVVAGAVESGFPLSAAVHRYLSAGGASIYRSDPAARSALFDGDRPKPSGSTIVFPGLAPALRHVGEGGADVFYRGDLAKSIVDGLERRGGQLTLEDMATYRAVARRPKTVLLGRFRLSTTPEPALGGIMVAGALEAEGVSDDQVALTNALIGAFQRRWGAGLTSPSTVGVAAGDEEGGAVAASFSAGYGSGVIPEGTGMLMNNGVGELELVPPGSEAGSPGERIVSNMAPTVARHEGEAVAIASPGADRITTAVATTLARLARGDCLRDAIEHPRAHPELADGGVRVATEPGVRLDGLDLAVREFDGPHMFFGGVNGAGMLDGVLQAHADRRRGGSVAFTGSSRSTHH